MEIRRTICVQEWKAVLLLSDNQTTKNSCNNNFDLISEWVQVERAKLHKIVIKINKLNTFKGFLASLNCTHSICSYSINVEAKGIGQNFSRRSKTINQHTRFRNHLSREGDRKRLLSGSHVDRICGYELSSGGYLNEKKCPWEITLMPGTT